MILNNNTTPKREIYYLGSLTIEVLNTKAGSIDLFELFLEVNSREEMTMNLFLLVLDWLYLIEIIKHEDGVIKLCS